MGGKRCASDSASPGQWGAGGSSGESSRRSGATLSGGAASSASVQSAVDLRVEVRTNPAPAARRSSRPPAAKRTPSSRGRSQQAAARRPSPAWRERRCGRGCRRTGPGRRARRSASGAPGLSGAGPASTASAGASARPCAQRRAATAARTPSRGARVDDVAARRPPLREGRSRAEGWRPVANRRRTWTKDGRRPRSIPAADGLRARPRLQPVRRQTLRRQPVWPGPPRWRRSAGTRGARTSPEGAATGRSGPCLLVGGTLEPLDERLHLGDRARPRGCGLALVAVWVRVGGTPTRLSSRRRIASAPLRVPAPRRRSAAPPPTTKRPAVRRRRRRSAARRRCRCGLRRSEAGAPGARRAPDARRTR